MAPKQDVTSFIINALSNIQESLHTNGGVLRDTSEKVSNVDKRIDVLGEKIIAYDAKHEAHHKEIEKRVISLETEHKEVKHNVEDILGWKGKVLFLVTTITFIASILGINGIDLIKKIVEKKVDMPYAMGVQSYPNYGQDN